MQTIPFQMEADIDEDGVAAVRLVGERQNAFVNAMMSDLFTQAKPRGVWNDARLDAWNKSGGITLDGKPWAAKIGPSSIDLHLDGTFQQPHWYWRNRLTRWIMWHMIPADAREMKKDGDASYYWGPKQDFIDKTIWPGESLLLSTLERVEIPLDAVGVIFLRSTPARRLLEHAHAGFLDAGFRGNVTLEVVNLAAWPILLSHVGSYVQVAMFDLSEAATLGYTGRYQDQVGVTAPRKEVSRGIPQPPAPEPQRFT